jgi:hypothetical protein
MRVAYSYDPECEVSAKFLSDVMVDAMSDEYLCQWCELNETYVEQHDTDYPWFED